MRLDFRPSHGAKDRELLLLKRSLGGSIGELSVAGHTQEALKLGENIYVTPKRVDGVVRIAANIRGVDIHEVGNAKEASFFRERYKQHERANA